MSTSQIQNPGTILFERYEIQSHIGEGGMGHVYKVLDLENKNILALKTLVPTVGKNSISIARFEREFSAMQKLDHPNIVKAYNFHSEGDSFFGFTMEIVIGEDLDSLIYKNETILEISEKVDLLEQIADGLNYAHSHNLIHRDLKPANILVSKFKNLNEFSEGDSKYSIKIADFGLAQQESDGADMTQSSNRIGTAYYMSPEQHRGEELDARTDIYSFGILAFELFTKRRPFDGSTTFKLFLAHVSEGIPEIIKINPEVPKWISTMVEICGEKNKNHRYSSMEEVLSLIRAKKGGGGFLSRIFNKKKGA